MVVTFSLGGVVGNIKTADWETTSSVILGTLTHPQMGQKVRHEKGHMDTGRGWSHKV